MASCWGQFISRVRRREWKTLTVPNWWFRTNMKRSGHSWCWHWGVDGCWFMRRYSCPCLKVASSIDWRLQYTMVIEGGHRRLETYVWRHHNAELEAVGSNPSKHPRSNNRIIKKQSAMGLWVHDPDKNRVGSGWVQDGEQILSRFWDQGHWPQRSRQKIGENQDLCWFSLIFLDRTRIVPNLLISTFFEIEELFKSLSRLLSISGSTFPIYLVLCWKQLWFNMMIKF